MDALIAKIWSFIGFFTLLQNILPSQLHQILRQWYLSLEKYFNPHYQVDIPEFKDNHGVNANDVYEDVQQYLQSLQGIARRLTVFRAKNSLNWGFCPADGEEVEDSFEGARVWWSHKAESVGGNGTKERRSYTLKLAKADKKSLAAYFNHVTKGAAEFNTSNKEVMLYTNTGDACYGDGWTGVPFKHSSTFASLALDPPLKRRILMDLDRFKLGKEFIAELGVHGSADSFFTALLERGNQASSLPLLTT